MLAHKMSSHSFHFCIEGGQRCDGKLTLEKVYKFVTGMGYEPLHGHSQAPVIEFREDPPGFLPTSNTCANILNMRYSLTNRYSAEELIVKFNYAFMNAYFGVP